MELGQGLGEMPVGPAVCLLARHDSSAASCAACAAARWAWNAILNASRALRAAPLASYRLGSAARRAAVSDLSSALPDAMEAFSLAFAAMSALARPSLVARRAERMVISQACRADSSALRAARRVASVARTEAFLADCSAFFSAAPASLEALRAAVVASRAAKYAALRGVISWMGFNGVAAPCRAKQGTLNASQMSGSAARASVPKFIFQMPQS